MPICLSDLFACPVCNQTRILLTNFSKNWFYFLPEPLRRGHFLTVCHNGTELRDSLPVWNGAEWGNGSEPPLGGAATKPACRNGTESRKSLPLWNGAERENGSEPPLGGAATKPACRNGTESRDSLPLWNGAERENGSERPLGGAAR